MDQRFSGVRTARGAEKENKDEREGPESADELLHFTKADRLGIV